jgi:phosphomannomutase
MAGISFGTDGWRATLDEFTEPRVRQIGRAVAAYLDDEGVAGDVLVGYDARPSSPGFADALADELTAAGRDVLRPERDCPTPLVAYGIVDRDCAGGLMLTASHNPPEYNGVKFIPDQGAPALPDVTDAIVERLDTDSAAVAAGMRGDRRTVDLVTPHADHAVDLVDAAVGLDLDGTRVAYDAMHGSGRGVTDALLERAGATVERRRCERSADFGGGSPEPVPERLEGLAAAVRDGDADLGIANDGDADRIAVATPERGVLNGNWFFAVVYDALLAGDSGPAVRTVSTTFLLDRIAEAHGETVHETPVGFKWVAEGMGQHDALAGGEASGGFSIRGHVREKDGVLMALLAAAIDAHEPFDDRIDRLRERYGDIEQDRTNVDCPEDRKQAVLDALGDAIPERVAGQPIDEINEADGFKLLLADGSWLLMRPSGTEPVMRVYAEGDSTERVAELLDAGRELVEPLV